MKKLLFIIASAVVVLSSCAEQDKLQINDNQTESVIGFTTYAEAQTKAADNNKNATNKWNLEDHNTTFDVWAWKYYNGQWVTPAVYGTETTGNSRKGVVTYTSNAWVADPLKYWDKSADKYYFYAAAPSSANWQLNNNGTATDFSDDYLTYADFKLTGTGINSTSYVESFKTVTDVDLMIAEDNVVTRDKYNTPDPADVNEIFDHILSRLNVTVALKNGGDLAKNGIVVKVTSFSITGVDLCNKGSFNENAELGEGKNLKDGTTERWNSTLDGTYNLAGVDIHETTLTTTPLYIAQYLIIPQEITCEVLDRAKATLPDTYYTQAEIDAAQEGDDAYGKKTTDVKTSGAAAKHTYLTISYTINDEPFTAYYNLANAFGKTANETVAFNEGWQNLLNIQLDADVIEFDPQVYEWTNNENKTVTIFD